MNKMISQLSQVTKNTLESEAKIPVVVDANDNPHPMKPRRLHICGYCEKSI